MGPGVTQVNKTIKTPKKKGNCYETKSDKEVMEMLREEMAKVGSENGKIDDIPEGENMFMLVLLQGKPGTEPMQVFCDSGANFWFAKESVTKKLISVQTFRGALPINIAGDNVVYSTGEWAAAIPLADGSYQGVRGLTMKHVVGQMPRFSLARNLKQIQEEYKLNKQLQQLAVPDVLGGEIDMILGSKYLKIYPEPIQVTPSGLTVSRSKFRSPGGKEAAVISGPVKFLNQIFQSMNAKDCMDSMKAMLLTLSTYRPTLEHFPRPAYIAGIIDDEIPGILDMLEEDETIVKNDCNQNKETKLDLESNKLFLSTMLNPSILSHKVNSYTSHSTTMTSSTRTLPITDLPSSESCPCCGVTVQSELQKFLDMQEAGLKTEFRCKQCRDCQNCRKGAGHEKVSMRQEAEQELIKESIVVKEEGYAIAKLPFVLNPEENLKNNRQTALGMLNSVLKKYCKKPEERSKFYEAIKKMLDKRHLVFVEHLTQEQKEMLEKAKVSYWIPWNIQFKDSPFLIQVV